MIKAQKSFIPATITLAQNQSYFVASVYDMDYLPYTAPTVAASTLTQAANGTADPIVNIQGSITTSGITVSIPVTATGDGTLPAYSTSVNIPASLTEDGISRDLTLSWASQDYTAATTNITATIATVEGTLNAKKLDINAGMGNDYLGILLGQLGYPCNSDGNTTTYSVRDIPGIPDKMFGLADNGTEVRHNFLYIPIPGEDGKVWLNNNLGADYANVNSASFNPAQQATAATDYHAYGSFFQWGRKPDGHELMSWTSATAGTPVNGTTTTKSDEPDHALFIELTNEGQSDWRVNQSDVLWATESSANNPCPRGFRVPTHAELSAFITAAGISNRTTAASSKLHFSVAGIRNYQTSINLVGDTGFYWTSTVFETQTKYYDISTSISYNNIRRGNSLSVRCIKD